MAMFGLFGKSDEEIKEAIAKKEYDSLPASVIEELAKGVIVTTESHMPDYRILQRIEVVSAECVFGMNVFKDFFAGVRDVLGGRSTSSQKALREARRVCLTELRREALLTGANAVIGVDLDYSEISGDGKSMLFLVATGTAVTVEKL